LARLVSSVPAIQQALLDLLSVATALNGVLIRFAPPLKKVEDRERIYVIDEENYVLGGGEQNRVESFGARLVVEVFDSGDNPQRASDRRWELIDAIDDALMADDFQGYATWGGELRVQSTLFTPDDKSYVARSVLTISAEEQV
jgi:hypothetical protein